ncbi:hypothetical protein IMZ48_20825, partial [Candidatus Bathyarchaeota archaeon]|nr:hypothetical protein [Candidatus Bathyarchaeota archaeon]
LQGLRRLGRKLRRRSEEEERGEGEVTRTAMYSFGNAGGHNDDEEVSGGSSGGGVAREVRRRDDRLGRARRLLEKNGQR